MSPSVAATCSRSVSSSCSASSWWKTSASRLYDSTPPGLGAGGGTGRMWPSWRAGEVMPPRSHRFVRGGTRSPVRGLSRGRCRGGRWARGNCPAGRGRGLRPPGLAPRDASGSGGLWKLHAEGIELRSRDLAVELLRERLHAGRELRRRQKVRRQRLHGEGQVHDLNRVAV